MTDSFLNCWCYVHQIPHSMLCDTYFQLAQKDHEYCVRNKVHWLSAGEPCFPKALAQAPTGGVKAFFYKGNCEVFEREGVSVVGSRRPASVSLRWLEDYWVDFLKVKKAVTISGGAIGIDQKAHACALQLKSPTIAFLPSGFKSVYPTGFSSWCEPIVRAGGAVVSAFPLNMEMRKHHFHTRNRWIAQLGVFTLMVEGRVRSGSLMTARYALEQGKKVGTLPQSPYAKAQGFMDVLDLGGQLVRDCKDLILLYDMSRATSTALT